MPPKLIQAIYTTESRRGTGSASDPVRCVTEIFDVDGNLLGDSDPMKFSMDDMIGFSRYYYRIAVDDKSKTEQDIFDEWFSKR